MTKNDGATNNSRIKNTSRNTFFGALMYLAKIVLQFVVRAFFNRYFISEYLGLNGLYTNILNVLSLAELGVGNAIVYSMYKPISENDTETIKSLVALYKKIYCIIGCVITVIGLALIPALPYLIKDVPDVDINLSVIYVLYLAQTVTGYFFAYRRSLVFAYQRNDIESKISFLAQFVLAVCQIVIMVVWKNYYAYVSSMVICNTLDAVLIFIISFKLFPEIKGKAAPLDKAISKKIAKNTGAMVCHKIGSAVVFSTDSIIISAFVSLTVLGLYSNYTLVTNALASAITLLVAAMKGSIGNLIATGDNEKSYKIFKALNLLMMWFIGFLFIGIMVCVQDFISILGGDSSKQLPYLTVVLICLNFYVTQSRTMANNFKECAGLFWNDRFKPLFEAGINLGLDLLLVYFMGINGVILATIISTVTVPLWVEPYVLYKNYFKQHLYKYFLQYIFYILSTAASFGVTFFACYFIPHGGIGWFILRVVICLILPNLVYLLIYFKTPEFAYLFSAVKALFDRFGNKRATAQPSIDSDTANENNLKAEEQQNYESDTQSD
ncbi:MAG: lipopolysaccharide biosynthesis protein [Clostridia bacterium]|jgi:O-antigen/teichoic acid export membrane protein|nr:lipopolysaccharide biosynthesis protein [Clostridia bacterium]